MSETLLVRLTRLEERFLAASHALPLQAAEYERRLDALNHENARVAKVTEHTVSRELFDAKQDEMLLWRTTMSSQMAWYAGAATVVGALIGVFVTWATH